MVSRNDNGSRVLHPRCPHFQTGLINATFPHPLCSHFPTGLTNPTVPHPLCPQWLLTIPPPHMSTALFPGNIKQWTLRPTTAWIIVLRSAFGDFVNSYVWRSCYCMWTIAWWLLPITDELSCTDCVLCGPGLVVRC